jgi:CheY-like chemotaxis protein
MASNNQPKTKGQSLNVETLRVFVVDDNAQMREIISRVLRSFGIKNIRHFADGQALINVLAHDLADIIFCDLLMEPMDGLSVLKAIRFHTNQIIARVPIVILTGERDIKSVVSARDLGATEYLLKPISPSILWKRVLSLLVEPRDFVITENYRGPMPRNPNDSSELAKFFPSPVPLDRKNTKMTSSMKDAVSAAKASLAELGIDYPAILKADVAQLQTHFSKVQAEGFTEATVKSIFRKAHDLKGQAATFGFDLVTSVSASLCTLLRKVSDHPDQIRTRKLALATVVSMHIEAIDVCASQNITGNGGADGTELLQTLAAAVKRVSTGLES